MKTRNCWYCGDDLGYEADSRDRETCGKRECAREASLSWREDRDEAAIRAEQDGYSLYY